MATELAWTLCPNSCHLALEARSLAGAGGVCLVSRGPLTAAPWTVPGLRGLATALPGSALPRTSWLTRLAPVPGWLDRWG